jgi:hypothetical protein
MDLRDRATVLRKDLKTSMGQLVTIQQGINERVAAGLANNVVPGDANLQGQQWPHPPPPGHIPPIASPSQWERQR